MRSVLNKRLGVPVPLEDDALGLIGVEVNGVLQCARVLSPRDLHGLSGQALELLELALVKLESSDSLKLTHGSGLQTPALLTERWAGGVPKPAAVPHLPGVGDIWRPALPGSDLLRHGACGRDPVTRQVESAGRGTAPRPRSCQPPR